MKLYSPFQYWLAGFLAYNGVFLLSDLLTITREKIRYRPLLSKFSRGLQPSAETEGAFGHLSKGMFNGVDASEALIITLFTIFGSSLKTYII